MKIGLTVNRPGKLLLLLTCDERIAEDQAMQVFGDEIRQTILQIE